jgi:flagellar basal-body rod protein FlgF
MDAPSQLSTSIDALTQEFEIITHNLANASTAGFKRRCNAFSKVLDKQQGDAETYSPGVIDLQSAIDFTQGGLNQTGRPLDLAIQGKGFFVIETPDGPLYTRNGSFQTDANGQLTDFAGRIVSGDGGPITIPATVSTEQLSVSAEGQISANDTNMGKIKIVDFGENESKLVAAGGNCFAMPDKDIQPAAADKATVRQGYQEASNVKIVDEMVDMIMVSRLYEANMKYLTAQQNTSSSLTSVAMG